MTKAGAWNSEFHVDLNVVMQTGASFNDKVNLLEKGEHIAHY